MPGPFWKPPTEGPPESSNSDSESEELAESEGEASDKLLEETWLEWMHQCTHNAEEHLEKSSIEHWVVAQRRRKWRLAALAGHTARSDGGRWSEVMLGWLSSTRPSMQAVDERLGCIFLSRRRHTQMGLESRGSEQGEVAGT